MKILKNNFNPKINTIPKQATCEHCKSILEYTREDINIGEFGCAYLICPVCEEKTYLDDEDGLKLTKDNLIFPQHFHHIAIHTGAVSISDEKINNWIREGIDYFRRNKDSEVFSSASGDTSVIIQRFDGDKEYNIIVTKDYYETVIPFEECDYEVCDYKDCDKRGKEDFSW